MSQENSACLACHADPDKLDTLKKIDQQTGQEVSMLVDEGRFLHSAHGRFPCTDCHPDLEDVFGMHAPELERVDCVTFCHEQIATVIDTVRHVRFMHERQQRPPGCKDCHAGEHSRRDTPVALDLWHRGQSIADCSRCHQEWLQSYRRTLHGQLAALGPVTMAVPTCADCHGYHRVVSPPHPRAQLGAERLAQTCGGCHQGVPTRVLDYIAHPQWQAPVSYPVLYYMQRAAAVALWVMLSGVTGHTVLWWWRLRRERHTSKD